MDKKVSVIGIGRLGLAFALLLDSKGYDVMGCDVNENYLMDLQQKNFKSNEPYINEMLSASKMNFTVMPKLAFEHSDLIFVFVQTPSLDTGAYSHKYVDQIVNKIIEKGVRYKTLVIGCTVMPGYCDSVQDKLFNNQIDVVYNPEFIAQGSIIDGLKNADIVLFGGNVPNKLSQLYFDIMGKETIAMKYLTRTGAEIAKISINCFLTMKIAFANLIGEIAIGSGESAEPILDAVGSDSRIGNKYLNYGFPAGGVCLPRDQKALNTYAYFVWSHTKFLHAIDDENKRHLEWMVNYYKNRNQDKSVPFVFSYLGYKKGVDILTDSYQLNLCIELLREGYMVDVPADVKYRTDMPEEFKDFVYQDKVTFGETGGEADRGGYKIN